MKFVKGSLIVCLLVGCYFFVGFSQGEGAVATPTPSDHSVGEEVSLVLPEMLISGDSKASLVIRDLKKAQRQMNQTAGAVSVINADSYKTGRAANLKDALNWAPGVFVQPRFGQEEARVSIRGSGIQQSICGGSGLMILQDGMPVNISDGSFNMQSIEPLATQYTEVYRGANSLQYGSTVLGGAINFVSYTGHDASPLLLRFEGGSFNTFREQISSGEVFGKNDYYLSVTDSSTDAYRDHAKQANFRIFSNIGSKLSPETESRLFFAYVDTKSELPGPLEKSTAYSDPRAAFPINVTNDWQKDYTFLRLGDKTAWERGDNRLEGQLFWDQIHLHHVMSVLNKDLNNDLGGLFQWQNKQEFLNHRNKLRLGVTPTYGFTTDLGFLNDGGQPGQQFSNNEQYSLNLTTFLQDQFYLLKKLSLVVGSGMSYAMRQNVDRWSKMPHADQASHSMEKMDDMDMGDMGDMGDMDMGDMDMSGMDMGEGSMHMSGKAPMKMDMSCCATGDPLSEIQDHSGTQNYWGWTPQVGMLYDLNRNTQAYANVSRSFAPPSFEQLVNQNFVGILPLKAETATTLETGTRGSRGALRWDLAYYYSWVNNEFFPYSINTPTGPSTLTENEPRTIHQGVEAALEMTLFQRIFCGAPLKKGQKESWDFPNNGCDRIYWKQVGLFNDFHFNNDPDFGNNNLPGIPKLYYRTELLYEHPKGFYFGPNLEWVPVSYDVDSANTLSVNPYAILGLKAGYRPKKGPSIYIEAMNICNTTYTATTGVIPNAQAPLANTAQFFPGDGAAVYAGVQYSF